MFGDLSGQFRTEYLAPPSGSTGSILEGKLAFQLGQFEVEFLDPSAAVVTTETVFEPQYPWFGQVRVDYLDPSEEVEVEVGPIVGGGSSRHYTMKGKSRDYVVESDVDLDLQDLIDLNIILLKSGILEE